MCLALAPAALLTGALSIGSSALGYAGQASEAKQAAQYQNQQYAAVSAAAIDSYRRGLTQLQLRGQQTFAAASQEAVANHAQADAAAGSANATLAAHGVSGNTADLLLHDFATIEATMNRIGVPATVHGSFQGTAKVFQDSLSNQPYLILAALITIYIVLGVLYESYVHPLTILSTLPSAGVGRCWR